ncbi:MAG: ATPase [Deltaproteobacteria bacterium]
MDKGAYGRRDRLIQEKRHDTYKEYGKWPEPTVCTVCKSLFIDGRWTWRPAPADANQTICPACQRIRDHYPAGILEIRGPFFREHRDEILNLIRNEESLEKDEHPMERLMGIVDTEDMTTIETTGVHIARRLGEAISRAYQGTLDIQYQEGEKSIRVTWER